jgi:hypothetical protein
VGRGEGNAENKTEITTLVGIAYHDTARARASEVEHLRSHLYREQITLV